MSKIHYSPVCFQILRSDYISMCGLDVLAAQVSEDPEQITCKNCIRIQKQRCEADVKEAQKELNQWHRRERDLGYEARGFRKIKR